jgi:hypothetical protein
MGFLGKIANFASSALKKVGQIGGEVIGKVAHMGVPIYRAANAASGGFIGNALNSLPVVGGIVKPLRKVLGNPNTMNKLSNGFGNIGAAGSIVGGLASKLGWFLPI